MDGERVLQLTLMCPWASCQLPSPWRFMLLRIILVLQPNPVAYLKCCELWVGIIGRFDSRYTGFSFMPLFLLTLPSTLFFFNIFNIPHSLSFYLFIPPSLYYQPQEGTNSTSSWSSHFSFDRKIGAFVSEWGRGPRKIPEGHSEHGILRLHSLAECRKQRACVLFHVLGISYASLVPI